MTDQETPRDSKPSEDAAGSAERTTIPAEVVGVTLTISHNALEKSIVLNRRTLRQPGKARSSRGDEFSVGATSIDCDYTKYMQIKYSVEPLDTPEDWSRLTQKVGDGHPQVVDNTIRHLKVLGAMSYVCEEPYIDRDYSADYLHFYARTFRTHDRHCKRIHFFSEDVTSILRQTRSTVHLSRFREIARTSYCGFCVVRPLPTAPIGRTVLQARLRGRQDMEATVTCPAGFNANLFGVDMEVTGVAYLQQDSRVGACAQVSIWTGMRHMHARHGYDWVSVADITKLATPTAPEEAASLPAGSDFLTAERMLRAIDEAGYQPLCFHPPHIARAILPYVESGIPVILGLNIGGKIGHTVTVIGRVFAKQDQPTATAIDYIPAYIVHDDQGGPYMYLPLKDSSKFPHPFAKDTIEHTTSEGTIELSASDPAATFAVALMSPRVFSTAVAAEVSASDRIKEIMLDLPGIRQILENNDLSANDRLLNELQLAFKSGHIVLRTYLTSAAGYRRHLTGGTAGDELKHALLELHLPHFTWITEIATIDSFNHSSAGLRRIYGHTIIDATSTGKGRDGLLALHLPGLLFTRDVSTPAPDRETLSIIRGDDLYECRDKHF